MGIETKIRLWQRTLVGITCLSSRNRTIRLYIFSLNRLSILIISLFCQIESIWALTYHETFHKLTCARNSTRLYIRTFAIRNIQFSNLRIIPGIIKSYSPCKILGIDRHSVDRKFHTLIVHLTNISGQDSRIVHTRNHRNRIQQILGMALVNIERTIDAVVKKTIVKTSIPSLCSLPFNVSIISVWAIGIVPFITKKIAGLWIRYRESGHVRIVIDNILLTGKTIAQAQLQIGKHLAVLKKFLFREFPSQSYRRKIAPSVSLCKTGRSISTQGSCNHIFIGESIIQAAIQRQKIIF